MSIDRVKSLAIYSNLPSGGANEIQKLNIVFLKQRTAILTISDRDVHPKNLISYLYTCTILLPKLHRSLAASFTNKARTLIAYHSWLTKSPHILRYVSGPKVYVCQELMREYYDPIHIANQTFKERIVNLIRLPIKIIDRNNLKSKNLTVISNSNFSKKMIDQAYNVSSKVIYPGINTMLYESKMNVNKRNQIISVGAINKLKGYEFIIRVVSKIDSTHRPTLVIIGNGVDRQYLSKLQKLALHLDVEMKVYLNVTRKFLIMEYHRSKLFIYSPLNEPFGIVVEEAMASSLPLVVYRYGGGYSEILDDRNGLIIDNLNPEYWASSIENLMTNENLQTKYANYNSTYVRKYFDQKKMNNDLWDITNHL